MMPSLVTRAYPVGRVANARPVHPGLRQVFLLAVQVLCRSGGSPAGMSVESKIAEWK